MRTTTMRLFARAAVHMELHYNAYRRLSRFTKFYNSTSNQKNDTIEERLTRLLDFLDKEREYPLLKDPTYNNQVSLVSSLPGSRLIAEPDLENLRNLLDSLETLQIQADSDTFVRIFLACGNMKALPEGKRVHAIIVRKGRESDMVVSSKLLDMYLKCDSLDDAREVFSKMPTRGVISWTRMIAGNIQGGYLEEALLLFQQMQREGVKPDQFTFVTILNVCNKPECLAQGISIHRSIIEKGFQSNIVVGNALITMYTKCGSLAHARTVFDGMTYTDLASWNVTISAYAQQGICEEAFRLFHMMLLQGIVPNKITFVTILNACVGPAALPKGRKIHSYISNCGLDSDGFVGTALVNMYGKCGNLEDASKAFYRVYQEDVISWTSIIAAYSQEELYNEALQLYKRMQLQGVRPNKVTLVTVLKACTTETPIEELDQIHANVVESGLVQDGIVRTALINLYGKCNKFNEACKAFEGSYHADVFLRNAMIAAYAQHGQFEDALYLFQQLQLEGIKSDKFTFTSMANACNSPPFLLEGKRIHQYCAEDGYTTDTVMTNAIINMYVNCGSLESACKLIQNMQHPDVVTWSTVIAGYVEQGLCSEGIQLFRKMQLEGLRPNKVTFVAMLDACTAAFAEAKRIHSFILEAGLEADTVVGNAIIDMYGKCGNPQDSRRMFDKLTNKDDVSWNAMISALSQHGYVKEMHNLLWQMQQQGFKPNDVTFVSIFSACSHAGTLEDACENFRSMVGDHGMTPSLEHYGCIIDLLGRAGWLSKAEDMITRMPFQQNLVMLKSLLAACKTHGDVQRGERVGKSVYDLDSKSLQVRNAET